MTKAFTILELMIVLGIMAVLLALGVAGLNSFRYTVQLEQVRSGFISSLRLAENMARNAVASAALSAYSSDILQGVVDGYAIFWQDHGYSLHYCLRQGTSEMFDCRGVENNSLQPQEIGEVTILLSDPAKCNGVMFTRLTGDMSALAGEVAQRDDVGECIVTLRHDILGNSAVINLNLAENSIAI